MGLTHLNSPYAYSFTDGAHNTWLTDYTRKMKYIESLSPSLYRFWSIDEVDNDVSYAQAMAPVAVAAANGRGFVNGFGSQGLSLQDKLTSCLADWCNLFGTQHPYGSPLELQQISISDPTNTMCSGGSCGLPPLKNAGDLRLWLPFAVMNNATVLELYYQDLGLAYDPKYCTAQVSLACTAGYFPLFITPTQEWTFFSGSGTGVGQGTSCTQFSGATIGTGDCSYAAAIDAAHGPH